MSVLLPMGASRLDLVSLISRNSSDWVNFSGRQWALHNLTHPVFRGDECSGISIKRGQGSSRDRPKVQSFLLHSRHRVLYSGCRYFQTQDAHSPPIRNPTWSSYLLDERHRFMIISLAHRTGEMAQQVNILPCKPGNRVWSSEPMSRWKKRAHPTKLSPSFHGVHLAYTCTLLTITIIIIVDFLKFQEKSHMFFGKNAKK